MKRVCFLGAKTVNFSPVFDVQMGVATDPYFAINWMREIGVEKVIFELDLKLVVDGINYLCVDLTEFGVIISSCKDLSFFF